MDSGIVASTWYTTRRLYSRSIKFSLVLNIVCCCEGEWVCAVLLICAGDVTNEDRGQRLSSVNNTTSLSATLRWNQIQIDDDDDYTRGKRVREEKGSGPINSNFAA
jgi:hypothetical protein